MFWKPEPQESADNLDNIQAACAQAKTTLAELNNEIKLALEQKAALLSENDILTKQRKAELDELQSEAEKKNSDANALYQAAVKRSQDAYEESGETQRAKISHQNKVDADLKNIEQLEASLAIRQQEAADLLTKLANDRKEFEIDIKLHGENVEGLNKAKDQFQIQIKDMFDAQAKIEEQANLAEQIQESTKAMAEAANADKAKAQKILDDAIIIQAAAQTQNSQAEETLSSILKEKENNTNIIIENKRAKLDADKSIEQSQKLIVEANQKIAELSELKAALAK